MDTALVPRYPIRIPMAKSPLTVHTSTLVKVSDLNPAAYNPRKITPEKYEALKENIRTEGFLDPIIVQKTGLKIIGGHQRLKAWKELAIEACIQPPDLPCIVLDIDDVRAKKLNIKMNALKGDFEARMLGELLIDIYDEPKIPLEEALSLGFDSEDDALKYMHLIEPPIKPERSTEPKTFGKSITLSLEFTNIETRDRIKKVLMQRTEVEKKKTGDIVAALLAPKPRGTRGSATPHKPIKVWPKKKTKKRAA
jgi:hypothetical protein